MGGDSRPGGLRCLQYDIYGFYPRQQCLFLAHYPSCQSKLLRIFNPTQWARIDYSCRLSYIYRLLLCSMVGNRLCP